MQKRVLFWQRTPFDIFSGGDGLYLHKLKLYFLSIGWDIVTITSYVHRPYLYATSKYYLPNSYSSIRGAFRVGRFYFFSPLSIFLISANFIFDKLYRLIGRTPGQKLSRLERAWVSREVERANADLVIKCFDKFGHKEFSLMLRGKALHLVGFMNNDEYTFSNNNIVHNDSLDCSIVDNFSGGVLDVGRQLPAIGFSSKFDRDRLKNLLPERVSIYVGIGFHSKVVSGSSDVNYLVFVGNKTSLNKLAVENLIERILPNIIAQVPDARLRIIGRVCEYFNVAHANIDFLGQVDDLDEEYRRSKVVVAPLLVGSAGVKTKVAEGLAHGRVVVTTSLGVDSSDPNQLQGAAFVEDEPVRFAELVCKLLLNDDLRNDMEAKTLEVFDRNYSINAAYGDIAEWLDSSC